MALATLLQLSTRRRISTRSSDCSPLALGASTPDGMPSWPGREYSSMATGSITVAGNGGGTMLLAEQSTAAWAAGTRTRAMAPASAIRSIGISIRTGNAASVGMPRRAFNHHDRVHGMRVARFCR